MGNRLTKRIVDQATAGEKTKVLWDSDIKGFGCKVAPSGRKVYFLYYRTEDGQQRRPTIGRHGDITCEIARKTAKKWHGQIANGADPSGSRQRAKRASTMSELCDRYVAEHVEVHNKPSTVKQARRIVETKIKPKLGRRKVERLTRQDVMSFHSSMARTPREANHALAILSKMMNLAERWGLRPDGSNPCRHVVKYKERKRERFLSEAELAQLAVVLAEAEHTQTQSPGFIAAIRLLLFTGARLSEILTLRWEYVDMEGQCLRLPDSKTGAKVIYLPPPALEILASLERHEENSHVIVGTKTGAHRSNLHKSWYSIRAKAGLDDVRIHDLRHSFASMAVAGGLSLPVIGALLGHSQPATTARYAHLADDPLRQAANITG
ncbi:MAG: tyrosine-type recombinase/integrase, partial [Proteobacteria bacterium]|nr:tyrosine-type recombinase/integrase [Pseudomonadota bacterium]